MFEERQEATNIDTFSAVASVDENSTIDVDLTDVDNLERALSRTGKLSKGDKNRTRLVS